MRHSSSADAWWATAPIWLVAVVVALGGCTRSPASTPAPAPAPAQADDDHHDHQLPATPEPYPTVSAQAAADAQVAATTALAAFARRDLTAEAWFEGLAGHLTAGGQQAHYGTDPAEVPVSRVDGVLRVDMPSGYLARVRVGTDAGEYLVLVVREHGAAPWLVERISPA